MINDQAVIIPGVLWMKHNKGNKQCPTVPKGEDTNHAYVINAFSPEDPSGSGNFPMASSTQDEKHLLHSSGQQQRMLDIVYNNESH